MTTRSEGRQPRDTVIYASFKGMWPLKNYYVAYNTDLTAVSCIFFSFAKPNPFIELYVAKALAVFLC